MRIYNAREKEIPKNNDKGFAVLALLVGFLFIIRLLFLAATFYFFSIYTNVTGLVRIGKTINVAKGGDFQSALTQAKGGDVTLLEAGAVFKGSFKLPNIAGNDFVTIRSSADPSRLPPPGTRINPEQHVNLLPKIESNVRGEPAILAVKGAHHFRFVGIEFLPTIDGLCNIIQLGSTEEKEIGELQHHIEFDQVYIHGSPVHGQRRGIAANGKFIKIANSHISDIKRKGEESQAIALWATDGPVEIVNNYLEAAAENILFGGAESFLNLAPADCLVSGNHLDKPLKWREEGWLVKNLFEIKHGRRIKVVNNLMTNNWANGQSGTAVLFTTNDDSGKSVIIEDIEFSNNIVRSSPHAVNVKGDNGKGGHRLIIRNNFFEGIGDFDGGGRFMTATDWQGLTIENNTIINTGNITSAYGDPITGFIFRNNIIFENEYGFHGDSMTPGKASIDKYFPASDISFNVIIGGKPSNYSGKNLFVNSIDQIGFVDYKVKNYSLRADSPLRSRGFKGGIIGADLNTAATGEK